MKRWMLLFLLLVPLANAATYSHVDWERLPVYNVYDPFTHRNELITQYSYEELSDMVGSASFRQWNDVDKVCTSMQIMFGSVAPTCGAVQYAEFPRASTDRAYVHFEILPRPMIPDTRTIILVDPVYPPWSPTYNPYW